MRVCSFRKNDCDNEGREVKVLDEVAFCEGYFNYVDEQDIYGQAKRVVEETIKKAQKLISSDPNGDFFYKNPQPNDEINKYPSILDFEAEYREEEIKWLTIREFSVNEIFVQVRDFVNLWHLTPSTQFVLVIHDKTVIVKNLGTQYFIDAVFSKPTRRCPNPLAVARVNFTINVPLLLPNYFPIMVKYKFEGYRTQFHALGEKALCSKDFQRLFIDSILIKKLAFYMYIFECRHGTETKKVHKKSKKKEHKEDEDLKKERSICRWDMPPEKKRHHKPINTTAMKKEFQKINF